MTAPSHSDIRRWRKYLANERAEAAVYRDLASRREGEEREILLALAQRAEGRSPYEADSDATDAMAADERIHGEVVRGLAIRGRLRISGTFRAAVFGANDGLVSNLALVLGIGATGVSTATVLFTGIAGLLAGALSMGAGEYVSVRSQRELIDAAKPDPESQQALPNLDVDANELALVYRARGMSQADAEAHAREVLSTLHLPADAPVESDEPDTVGTAWGAAFASFCFFASGALIPVLPYLFGATGLTAVVIASVLVGLALLGTGAVVGLLSGASPLKRALRQLAIGFGAAGATYLLGLLFGATVG
jgi:VIT1/CCC1 family predicted Fe2+/Mn2+ transporter